MQNFLNLALLVLPLISSAQQSHDLHRRDDTTDGGGAPSSSTGSELTNWVSRPGKSPSAPDQDSFYSKVPSNLTKYANGDIISKRLISLAGSYQGIDNALQIKIRTEDAHDAPSVSIATVIIPSVRGTKIDGTVPIVVYQASEDASYTDCAPTYTLFGRAIPAVQSLISNGFVVVIPDYEGHSSSYTVGKLAGKQILDAARAAVSIPTVKASNETASIGVWGYGTGAHATGWAAELSESYAPEVPLHGVALGGTVTNLHNWLNSMNASPNAGLVISSLLGMASQYKDVSDALSDNVVPHRRSQFESAATRCSVENLVRYFETNVTSQYFTPGVDLLNSHKVQAVYDLNSLGQVSPKASVYAYHGGDDTVASATDLRLVLKKYCSDGTIVKYREIEGASHMQAESQYDDVLDYFSSALLGAEPISSCQRIVQGSI